VSGGLLDLGQTSQRAGVITLNSGRIESGTLRVGAMHLIDGTVSALLAGTGSVSKSGAGTVVLETASTYTGGTRITGGTLALGGDERLSGFGGLAVEGGALELGGFTQTVAGVALNGGEIRNGTLIAASYELRLGSVSASMGGAGSVVKSGDGTVTLSGVNRYGGGASVEAGRLVLAIDGALSESSSLSVSSG
jgi:autotransporter-associated beta strand protein